MSVVNLAKGVTASRSSNSEAVPYNAEPRELLTLEGKQIASFVSANDTNTDHATLQSFGSEWKKFSAFSQEELQRAGDQYFNLLSDEMISGTSVALDIGCGTGRWSKYLAPRVKWIEAVDPGEAVASAVSFTAECSNIRVTKAGYGSLPFAENTFDFVFSLGVVHHVPDTAAAIREAVGVLRKGGWILFYIYYNLENRGLVYRTLFFLADGVRRCVSKLPSRGKFLVCDILAIVTYLPFVWLSRIIKSVGFLWWKKIPLAYYADKSWRIIKNDALDRFGTPLEKRFSRKAIEQMLQDAGLSHIQFSCAEPYWLVIGKK